MARAKHALDAAGLDATVELTRMSSVTNEVWLSDDFAVRVNRRPDKRLWREAQLGSHLPAEVRYPEVVAYGNGTGFDWLVTRRSPGGVLSRCWPTMSCSQRRLAVHDIARMLRALHTTPMPRGVDRLDESRPTQLLDFQTLDPVASLIDALGCAAALPNVDSHLMNDLVALVRENRAAVGSLDARTLVHGDLTFENVLWDGDGVTALIDFEWARPAPPDLELDVLLRFCAYPALHVAADYEAQTKSEAYQQVPGWLAEDYPELFAAHNLLDRLRIYAVAFELRQLLMLPPPPLTRELDTSHPLPRLRQLLSGDSYLNRL